MTSRSGVGRGLAVALVCGVLGAVPIRAGAQGEAPLEVRLERPWFGPETPLTFEVEVQNPSSEPLSEGRVSAALYERVRSRTALRAAFAGELPATPLEALTFRLPEVPPGDTRTLRIEEDDLDDAFEGAPDGLYPLSVGVRRSTGPTLSEAVTAVAFLGTTPPRPLNLLPVVVADPGPALDPTTGEPLPGIDLDVLPHTLTTLAEGPAVPFGLVVSPTALRELEVIAQQDAEGPSVPTLPAGPGRLLRTPATWARLPDLTDVPGELDEARRLLSERLASDPVPVVYPPGLVVDERSLEALPDDVRAVLVDGTLLGESNVTPARPLRVGGLVLVPTDLALGDAVTTSDGAPDVDRAVAETAMIYFERPGTERTLAVPIEPSDGGAAFVRALNEAPWLRPLSASEAAAVEATEADPTFPDVVAPPDAFRRAVRAADDAVGELEGYTLPDNALVGRLRAALGVARSTALWADDWATGRRYAGDVVDVARAQHRLVEISDSTVTFTSRRGEVPVTVMNRADYPVRLRIELSSPKIRFPEGATAAVEDLGPPGKTVTFPAVTESSGTFPLTVTLTSPDGRTTLDRRELIVRSAALNTLAVVVTSAAALFLVVWYGRRVIHRRGAREHQPAGRPDRHA